MLTNKKNNNMLLREFCYLSTYHMYIKGGELL